MARHPADVGRAPVGVVVLEVEDPLGRHRRAEQVAAGRVQDPLGLAGRSRGVEDVEGMLAVERLGGTGRRGAVHQLVPPVVAAGRPVDRRAGPPVDDDVLERGADRRGAVGVLLERDELAAAIAAVGGDQDLGLAVLDPAGERLGAEAAEDHRVRRADPGTGQERDHQLRDQRHVHRDDVARSHAQPLEHVGELRDLALEVLVPQDAAVARLALPDERRLVLRTGPRSGGRRSYTTAFSLPPTNHLANGGCQSSTLSHGLSQWSDLGLLGPEALRDRPWRGSTGPRTGPGWRCGPCCANSSGGGKTRVSCRTLVIDPPPWSELMVARLPVAMPKGRVCQFSRSSMPRAFGIPKSGWIWILRRACRGSQSLGVEGQASRGLPEADSDRAVSSPARAPRRPPRTGSITRPENPGACPRLRA